MDRKTTPCTFSGVGVGGGNGFIYCVIVARGWIFLISIQASPPQVGESSFVLCAFDLFSYSFAWREAFLATPDTRHGLSIRDSASNSADFETISTGDSRIQGPRAGFPSPALLMTLSLLEGAAQCTVVC